MPAGHKNFVLRGGGTGDFPSREISLKQIRTVSRIAWEKWGHLVADYPPRDLIALAYAEGLYHGAMIMTRDNITIGMMAGSASSAVAPVALSAPTEIETLSVRDLLESL